MTIGVGVVLIVPIAMDRAFAANAKPLGDNMPEIEFHERIDKSVAVGVHIGGRVVVMSVS